ncbi:hypothetical protein GCM10027066_28160 [Dyella jejuensis]
MSGCNQAIRKPAAPAQPPKPAIITGIPACDSYLNSYIACHRAASIYSPETLAGHYQAMRSSLLHDANDPRVRPYLANRCAGLTQQLNAVLQGHSCASPQTTVNH